MADKLLKLDDRGFLHCQITLQQYLPGLDPGLTALGAKEALVAEPTLRALQEAYGSAGRAVILRLSTPKQI